MSHVIEDDDEGLFSATSISHRSKLKFKILPIILRIFISRTP